MKAMHYYVVGNGNGITNDNADMVLSMLKANDNFTIQNESGNIRYVFTKLNNRGSYSMRMITDFGTVYQIVNAGQCCINQGNLDLEILVLPLVKE